MRFDSIYLFLQQVRNVFSFLFLQIKYKKDFLIVETYSFKEASKVGEFSFNPRVFLFIASFFGFLTVLLTLLVIQVTPLGYTLLSHQKHPMEEEFIQIAHRLKILSDSLQTVDTHIESFKSTLRNSDGIPLAKSRVGSQSNTKLGMDIAVKDSEIPFTKSVLETDQISEASNIYQSWITEFGVRSHVGPDYFIALQNTVPLQEFQSTQIKVETKKSE